MAITYKQLNPTDTATFGTKGSQVAKLQNELNAKGANLKVDSLYGPETQKAFNQFMGNNNQVSTGTPIGEVVKKFQMPENSSYLSDPNYQTALDISRRSMAGEDIVDTSKIRSDTLAGFQDRINAINQVYANQLAEAKIQGQGRVGQTTSILANRGLAGSIRGGAIAEGTLDQNKKIEGAIDDQRIMAINAIYGEVDKTAKDEAVRRRAAMEGGAKTRIEYLKAEEEIKANNANKTINAFIAQGIDPSTLSPEELKTISKNLGVSESSILSNYQQKKYELDQEAKKLDKEKRYVSIGDGAQLYDTETGKIVASNEKTFAPKASGGSGTGASGVGGNTYTSDLDALLGSTIATIPSKFGQEQFQTQLGRTRNDADKISLVGSVVLKNAPAEVKRDFANQSIGVSNIDKALAEIDKGAKTGFINSKLQKGFNLFGKDYDPSLTTIASYITAAIQPYRASVTGAAWGEQEEAEYQQLFGSVLYSPEELKQRLTTLKEIMKDKSAQGLNVFINPMDTYANPFVQTTQNTVAPTAPSNTVTVYAIKTGKAATIPAEQLQAALSSGLFRQ